LRRAGAGFRAILYYACKYFLSSNTQPLSCGKCAPVRHGSRIRAAIAKRSVIGAINKSDWPPAISTDTLPQHCEQTLCILRLVELNSIGRMLHAHQPPYKLALGLILLACSLPAGLAAQTADGAKPRTPPNPPTPPNPRRHRRLRRIRWLASSASSAV